MNTFIDTYYVYVYVKCKLSNLFITYKTIHIHHKISAFTNYFKRFMNLNSFESQKICAYKIKRYTLLMAAINKQKLKLNKNIYV